MRLRGTLQRPAALADHQRDSPRHNRASSSANGKAGPGGAKSKKSKKRAMGTASGGWGGGGGSGWSVDMMEDQNWALCDKDCGRCGHCAEGVDY